MIQISLCALAYYIYIYITVHIHNYSFSGSKSHSLGISFPHGMKKESRTVTFDNGTFFSQFDAIYSLRWLFTSRILLFMSLHHNMAI